MEESRKIFTLLELGKSLRSVIEKTYTATYWIKAEIAKLNFYPRSGHCYPELVDKSGNVIQAQMRSTIWAADFKRINQEFINATGEGLREGMSILFRASVGYHPVYGLSLQIWEVEPSFTLGEMALEKSKNIERLKKEEVFDRNKSLEMPLLVKRVAVISVETSKGYHDFLKIMENQARKYEWWHFLFPSVLQGDKAVEGIISQLRIIRKAINRFDMVAIIRGGGGDIGLNCYDDYKLAREIATFPLPVITGIGHATNETIAEMVAWSNKITPTDVAYFIVDKFRGFEQRVAKAASVVLSRAKSYLAFQDQKLNHLRSSVIRVPAYSISGEKSRLQSLSSTIVNQVRALQQKEKDQLDGLSRSLSLVAPKTLFYQDCLLQNQVSLLSGAVAQYRVKNNNRLERLERAVELLDPLRVLKRGYSITTYNGKSINSSGQLKKGNTITTRLYKGTIESTVSKNSEDS